VDNYSVEVKPSALKELEALPDAVLARIVKKIESLGQAPRPADAKSSSTSRSVARPAGDWRVLYIIDDAAKLISITRIAHRREVYDR